MYKTPPDPIARLLTPRVFFYVFLTLMTAWLMYRHSKHLEASGQKPHAPPEGKGTPPAAQLPFKESELSSARPRKQPMLILVGGERERLTELRQALGTEFHEACSIILLDTGRDAAALEFFGIGKTPAALLFDSNNQELARIEKNIDLEALEAWLKKQLPE